LETSTKRTFVSKQFSTSKIEKKDNDTDIQLTSIKAKPITKGILSGLVTLIIIIIIILLLVRFKKRARSSNHQTNQDIELQEINHQMNVPSSFANDFFEIKIN